MPGKDYDTPTPNQKLDYQVELWSPLLHGATKPASITRYVSFELR